MTVAGPVSSMTFIRDFTVLACAIGNKIFLYKVKDIFSYYMSDLLCSSLAG